MQYGNGPAEQREILPFGPTTLPTRITTARQLKKDGPPIDKTPAKGRDPRTGKGGRGTKYNPQKHSQEPAQDLGTGRAKERQQQLVDDPLDLLVAMPRQAAGRGVFANKSRD